VTARGFCAPGEAEAAKGAVHALATALCGVMAIYNGAAFLYRRERHLAFNAVAYGLATWWEAQQTARHWRRTVPRTAERSLNGGPCHRMSS